MRRLPPPEWQSSDGSVRFAAETHSLSLTSHPGAPALGDGWGHSNYSQRWPIRVIADDRRDAGDFSWNCLVTSVANWLCSESFTLSSPHPHGRPESDLLRDMSGDAGFAASAGARSMAWQCNRRRGLVYFEYIRNRLWMSSLDNTPDYPNRTITTEKHILTVFWNPGGFQVVTILPTGGLLNATWFIDKDFMPLRDHFFPGEGNRIRKSWWFITTMQVRMPCKWLETFHIQWAP
jgi:hypothetical protein